jgi:membrane protease YdiL (CAAX protease family)
MAQTAIPADDIPTLPHPQGWRAIFRNAREIRAGWSFLLFAVLYTVISAGITLLLQALLRAFLRGDLPQGWSPGAFSAAEGVSLLGALVALAVLGKIERRSFATYGFPLQAAFGARFWEGSLWGIGAAGATIAAIAAAGGYSVSGIALHGGALVASALAWGLTFLLVGISEEAIFRSFPLFTLARGLGFWPGALLLSAFFGALHYYTKPMETWMDAVSVGLIGLFLCLSVRRTGDVWFAVGFHFTFNFLSMAICGSPNTGNDGHPIPGHLLAGTFHGPDWLTGGPMGAEASAFIFPVITLLFLLFHLRFRTARFPTSE